MLALGSAENRDVVLADADRKYGSLLIGGQGSGKTSVALRAYRNDIHDPNAAVIVIDPKSELSRIALEHTPPDVGKRVWYLDLGRPAFGMTPLRMNGDQPFASEAAAIADGVVESLLDVNQGQIMQASRDLLYRSTIGALAIAHRDQRPPTFEDIYSLLLPGRDDARVAAATACGAIPDLDQTVEFFTRELPDDLKGSTSSTYDRLRAPRNKVNGIVGVPPLRRFLNHPTDLSLRNIVDNRDILIVDCNMAAIGEANAEAMMHFVFRQLHRQMQRQVRQPDGERPRVALICDEFHYLASRNVIKQIATHRAAGLDVMAGLQFFSQLGAGAESTAITDEIRKGVLNLLQSRFLFRLGDPDDAETATRVAMAVYSTMIRGDDPAARAHMRVTPEVILNLPRYHCLASWIVDGQRASSFILQTKPMEDRHALGWATLHREAQQARVGEYPEQMAGTLRRKLNAGAPGASGGPELAATPDAEHADGGQEPRAASAHAPVPAASALDPAVDPNVRSIVAAHADKPGPDIYERDAATEPDSSAVLALVGRPTAGGVSEPDRSGELPASLRELAFIDRINELRGALKVEPKPEDVGRVYTEDLAILKLLDRNGVTMPSLIGRAVMPDRSDSQRRRKLGKLYKQGLIGKRGIGITDQGSYRGQLPNACELTPRGFKLAQGRQAISDKREFRGQEVVTGAHLPHDHHALAWVIELHRLVGDVATDNWRTPRYATGRFPVPQIGNGPRRKPVGPLDVRVGAQQIMFDVHAEDFAEIKPDVVAEMYVRTLRLRFDVLVEYQHRGRLASFEDKMLRYDAFLTGWCLAHRRYQQLRTRPLVVVVAARAEELLDLARRTDLVMKGAVGVQGTAPQDWNYHGRRHVFFALEEDIHRGSLAAFALPAMPAALRARLGADGLQLGRVELLPRAMVEAARRKGDRGTKTD